MPELADALLAAAVAAAAAVVAAIVEYVFASTPDRASANIALV